MEEESLFLKYIRATLKKWTGFQAAIDEGMGGLYAREKEIWLGTEIEKYFTTYNDVKPVDLEEYVGTMIDNEFDTIFEDGSLFETCKLFCNAYKVSEDPNASIFQSLKKVPTAASSTDSNSQSEEVNKADKTEDVANKEDNVVTKLTALEIKDPEDEGWTVVHRKHKSTS